MKRSYEFEVVNTGKSNTHVFKKFKVNDVEFDDIINWCYSRYGSCIVGSWDFWYNSTYCDKERRLKSTIFFEFYDTSKAVLFKLTWF